MCYLNDVQLSTTRSGSYKEGGLVKKIGDSPIAPPLWYLILYIYFILYVHT